MRMSTEGAWPANSCSVSNVVAKLVRDDSLYLGTGKMRTPWPSGAFYFWGDNQMEV